MGYNVQPSMIYEKYLPQPNTNKEIQEPKHPHEHQLIVVRSHRYSRNTATTYLILNLN